MSREGVPLVVIQRQLGHANLGVTSVYLRGIDNTEIIRTVHERPAPVISATNGLIDEPAPISDNQIMSEISATDASKRFADMLDAVEHRGETFTVLRRGRPIATIAPARRTSVADLREFLRDHPADAAWATDLADLRRFVGHAPTSDPWSD